MIESLANVFDDSEDAMEEIVDEGNALFHKIPEEQNEAVEKIKSTNAKNIFPGVNGTNGIESLQGIIHDEEFNNAIKKRLKKIAICVCVPMIMDYIKSKDPNLLSRIETGDMKQEDQAIIEDIKPMCQCTKVTMAKWCMMY